MENNLKKEFAAEVICPEKEAKSIKTSDIQLWQAFKSGNNAAFLQIYESHFDQLFSYGFRICKDEDLVKDAIHDVFFELRKNGKTIGETDSIKFYLFKCLKRKIIKELTSWYNKQEKLNEHIPFEITFSHEHFLINSQIDKEKSLKISQALSELSPRKREAIYYLYYEGMSYEQIKELMDLSNAKSARDLVYKGLRSLRETIGFMPVFFLFGIQ
ncbi:RNA polymerase sigma factor [Echinicola jeungdonensis]|uniref:RNA polymerase sigma factor n=1 Tax=Echinicola jeungdonensis TaxID=709343 RepID=A0ABV5J8B7_9BACT|nr:RNA polymerase sigma factor [Echinicola jeungdonensis]MDN3669483.1 RNA polymerase sigma factor [Echinicola jeungdonensis]